MILAVIPARYASTRFPGKPLHLIAGKPLVQHVWERCRECADLQRILIATDDDRIADAARAFGAEVAMTSPDHQSGTDRIAEAARQCPGATHIINVQGDEPLISPELIGSLAQKLKANPGIPMVTAANPLPPDSPLLDDPNVVKTVLDRDGRALYFSRSRLPFLRNASDPRLKCYRHAGIYGYTREFLEEFIRWEPSMLEMTESLEQLRALENGAPIHVIVTQERSPGVDTPEQALEVERIILSGQV